MNIDKPTGGRHKDDGLSTCRFQFSWTAWFLPIVLVTDVRGPTGPPSPTAVGSATDVKLEAQMIHNTLTVINVHATDQNLCYK